jgi:hypothetical protein
MGSTPPAAGSAADFPPGADGEGCTAGAGSGMIPFAVGAVLALAATPRAATPVPWTVGETFEYSGKYLMFSAGSGTMRVVGVDTVRGVPSWHFSLVMNISAVVYHSHTEMTSWTGVNDFVSRRFVKVLNDSGSSQNRDYIIHADAGFYQDVRDKDTSHVKTPHDALDDISFIYYLRTIPLKVGDHDTIPRYFRNDKNPVYVDVVGRELIDMPDGSRTPCLVLHPVVNEEHGMFNQSRDARIWLTDDGRRIPVQIRSKYGANIFLKIKSIKMPVTATR